jgi:hypothetical protein
MECVSEFEMTTSRGNERHLGAKRRSEMTKTITVTNYLSGCPTCGANDGCVQVNEMLRCYCNSHKVSWDISQGLSIHLLPELDAEERERNQFIEDYEDATRCHRAHGPPIAKCDTAFGVKRRRSGWMRKNVWSVFASNDVKRFAPLSLTHLRRSRLTCRQTNKLASAWTGIPNSS